MRNLFWCLLLGILSTSGVFAQPELDTTFNGTGYRVLGQGYTYEVMVQPDNKVVLVGPCFGFGTGFCAIRLNENGATDFSAGVTIPGATTPLSALGAAIQGDGKLVLAGLGKVSSDVHLIMVRLNSNGSLDTSFGSGGIVQTDIAPGKDDRAQEVAIQPDGRIVVVGYIQLTPTPSENYQQFLARYLPDGTLDSSFGDGGIVRADASESTSGNCIVLQADGKIIAGGGRGGGGGYMLTRLNPDGSPDITWDGDGISTAPGGGSWPDDGFNALALQSDGRVVALGRNSLFRFNADGSLDTGFGSNGSRAALNGDSSAKDVMISAGGRITVVGKSIQTSQFGHVFYRVARYLPDGSPDTGFSEDGFFTIDLNGGSGPGAATSVAVDKQGRIVIGGALPTGSWGGNPVFSAARLLAPIVPVSIAGRVTRSNGNPVSNIVVSLGLNGTTIAISRTSPFGYYSFPGVMTGQEYSVSIKARGSLFPRHDVFVADDITNLDFVEGGTSTKAVETRSEVIEFQDDRKSPR